MKEMIMSLRSISFKRWCHVFVCFSYATHRFVSHLLSSIPKTRTHTPMSYQVRLIGHNGYQVRHIVNSHNQTWHLVSHNNELPSPAHCHKGYHGWHISWLLSADNQVTPPMKLPSPAPLATHTNIMATKSGHYVVSKIFYWIPIISFTHTLGVMFLRSQVLCLVYMHRLCGKTFHAFKEILKLN
jgi:hypothetical protein